jgi:hypothetical protein
MQEYPWRTVRARCSKAAAGESDPLGPEEDLIDALAKSLRVARRERGQ